MCRKWQPTQYSWLENPMDRGILWQATVHGLQSRKRLGDWAAARECDKLARKGRTAKKLPAWPEARLVGAVARTSRETAIRCWCGCLHVLNSFSHVQLFATLWTAACRLLCSWDSAGKNTGVGCHFLLQGIFLIQGSNPHLLCLSHWQAGSLPLALSGKPRMLWADTSDSDIVSYCEHASYLYPFQEHGGRHHYPSCLR